MGKEELQSLMLCGLILLLYLIRNQHPILKQLWKYVRLFLIILLVTLSANFIKKQLKSWWNEN